MTIAMRRVVVFSTGAGLLMAAVWVALALGERVPALNLAWPGGAFALAPAMDTWELWSAVAVVALVVGSLLLWLALSTPRRQRQAWLLLSAPIRDGRGATTISLSARSLHALVAYLGERVEGVRQVLPTVERAEEGWAIRCEVQLWTGVSAPEVSHAFREQLSAQIEHHTGLPVAAMRLDCTYDLEGEREALR